MELLYRGSIHFLGIIAPPDRKWHNKHQSNQTNEYSYNNCNLAVQKQKLHY